MFGYSYKEDALKWRKLEAENRAKFLDSHAKAAYTLHLVSGETITDVISRNNTYRDIGFLSEEYVKYPADEQIKVDFSKICAQIAKDGDTVNGAYYMAHTISKITLGAITTYNGENQ